MKRRNQCMSDKGPSVPQGSKIVPRAKTAATASSIFTAVDRVVPSYYFNYVLRLGVENPFPGFGIEGAHPQMQSEKLTQFEMKVLLWQDAMHSALRDTSLFSYPHFATVKSLLNYALNENNLSDIGLLSELFYRLLQFHPPKTPTMVSYYSHLLKDSYAVIHKKGVEEEPFFWVLISFFLNLPDDYIIQPEVTGWDVPVDPMEDLIEKTIASSLTTEEKLAALTKQKKATFFEDLSLEEKARRCRVCLEFLCDVLEADAISWLKSNKKKRPNRCLLAGLLWNDHREKGQLNQSVQKIINLQRSSNNAILNDTTLLMKRLLNLTAELIRCSDHSNELKYPFFGTNSSNFAREVSLLFLEKLKNCGPSSNWLPKELYQIRPPWFRLLVCSFMLGNLAGFQCLPELLSAGTIMEYVDQIYKADRKEKRTKENIAVQPADPALVAKYAKLKSVNTKLVSGLSRLHVACRQNKPDVVRALATFPALDLNQTDHDGWTALHHAAVKGSDACVTELLNYNPRLGDVQREVDTRARGPDNFTPLMRAAVEGHASVCTLLLQHTGSVLLEDVTDNNETALDLCTSAAVRSVLNFYSANKLETAHSRKQLHLTTNDLSLVVRLCYIFVNSYIATHRTWDVYHETKELSKEKTGANEGSRKVEVLCEYSRYHRDFKTNLEKLRSLVMKLKKVPELSDIIEDFLCMVSLNKT